MIFMPSSKIGTDLPTNVYNNGTMEWMCNGNRHRENGPAVVKLNGSEEYWIHGKLHRIDGPAIYRLYSDTKWYVNGTDITKDVKEWLLITNFKWPLDEYQQTEFKLRFCCDVGD